MTGVQTCALPICVGFGATGKYSVNDNIAVGANLHYNSFAGTQFNDPYYNAYYRNHAGIFALTGLCEYYFSTDKLKPLAGADLGLYFWNTKFYYYGHYWVNPAGHPVYGYDYWPASGVAFGFAPYGGATYDVSDNITLSANLKFNIMFTSGLNYIGLNFGGFYKFGK